MHAYMAIMHAYMAIMHAYICMREGGGAVGHFFETQHRWIDLDEAVSDLPLSSKTLHRKDFSEADNQVAGLGEAHQ